MKRLFKSSGFWIFVFASIILTTVWKLTESELLITLLGGLGILDKGGKVAEDFINANKGVQFNPETDRHERI